LSLSLLHDMRDFWRREERDVRLVLYQVLATGPEAGIIEVCGAGGGGAIVVRQKSHLFCSV
jgi:hypothetical protein